MSNSLQQANKIAEQMSYKNNVIKIDLCLIHYIYFRNRKQKKTSKNKKMKLKLNLNLKIQI